MGVYRTMPQGGASALASGFSGSPFLFLEFPSLLSDDGWEPRLFGARIDGDPAEAEFDLRVSSLRGVVGKDIYGIGFFGGAGWDRYEGDATLVVANQEGGVQDSTGSGKLESDRLLFFFGASMTFLALQLSAEAGWAEGFDPELRSFRCRRFRSVRSDPASGHSPFA